MDSIWVANEDILMTTREILKTASVSGWLLRKAIGANSASGAVTDAGVSTAKAAGDVGAAAKEFGGLSSSLKEIAPGLSTKAGATLGTANATMRTLGGTALAYKALAPALYAPALGGGALLAMKAMQQGHDLMTNPKYDSTKTVLKRIGRNKGDVVKNVNELRQRGLTKLPDDVWKAHREAALKKGGVVYSPAIKKGIRPSLMKGALRANKGKLGVLAALIAAGGGTAAAALGDGK